VIPFTQPYIEKLKQFLNDSEFHVAATTCKSQIVVAVLALRPSSKTFITFVASTRSARLQRAIGRPAFGSHQLGAGTGSLKVEFGSK
jgi:hypothetical protein